VRIVIAVHHFPPRYTGGAEWRAYRTAAALQARGHEVRVVCVERIDAGPDGGVAWEETVYEGIPVRRLSFNRAAAPDPFRWDYDNPWIGNHLREYLAEHRPDVFHLISGYLMGAGGIGAASEAGLPVIATLTDYWFICPRGTLLRSDGHTCVDAAPRDCVRCLAEEKRRYRWPARVAPGLMAALWASPLADRLDVPVSLVAVEQRRQVLAKVLSQLDLAICPSEFLRKVYARAGAPADRLIHLRQGLALSGEALPKLPSGTLRIGYIGQLVEHKGVHLLIKAFKRLNPQARPVTLTIYGDPTRFPRYARRLQRLANSHPSIRFAGTYSHRDLGHVLSGLDVIVVPSIWYENSPNAILEAFACRTPVVASDLGGAKELIDHGRSGLLFASGDVADLRRQLQRLVDEPGLVQQMSAEVPPVRSLDEEIEELDSLYKRVV
jgi:glycosyltransferase involved in cell wall biosynthesis